MNIVTPNTGSIQFAIRTRPTASCTPFKIKINWTDEESNVTGSMSNITASYNSNDFLINSCKKIRSVSSTPSH